MSNLDLSLRIKAEGAREAEREVERLKESIDGTQKASTDAGRATGDAAKSVEQLSASAVKAAAAIAGALGITAAFQNATRNADEFRTKIAEVSTLVSDTSDVDRLSQATRELAAEYGKSPVDQAAALYNVISSGATDAADATRILDQANRLSVAGITDVNTAANGLTSVLNSYALGAESVEQISDQFFATVQAGKTTVDELASAVGQVTPLASQAAVGFGEVGAAIATLTASGVSTGQAVTQLRGIISSVISPSKEATETAEALGLEFNLASLRAKGLAGFLDDVAKATNGSAEAQSALFGRVEALSGALTLTGTGADAFARNLDTVNSSAGATDAALQKVRDSGALSSAALETALKNLSITFGDTIQLVRGPLQEFLTSAINGFLGLPEPVKTTALAITGLSGAALALTASLRVIAPLVTTLIPNFGALTTAAGLKAAAMTAAAGATNLLVAALARLPFLAVTGGIIALGAAYLKLKAAQESAAAAQEKVNNTLIKQIDAAKKVRDATDEVAAGADEALAAIGENLTELTSQQLEAYEATLAAAEENLQAQIAIGARQVEVYGATEIQLDRVGSKLREVREAQQALRAEIESASRDPYAGIRESSRAAVAAIKEVGEVSKLSNAELVKVGQDAKKAYDQAADAVESLSAEFPNLAEQSENALRAANAQWLESIDIMEELQGIIRGVADEALKRLGVDASQALTGVRSNVIELIDAFDALALDASTDAKIIEAAYTAVLKKLESPEELEAFRQSLERAGQAGFDVAAGLEAVEAATAKVTQSATAQVAQVNSLVKAYPELGRVGVRAGEDTARGHDKATGAARTQRSEVERLRNSLDELGRVQVRNNEIQELNLTRQQQQELRDRDFSNRITTVRNLTNRQEALLSNDDKRLLDALVLQAQDLINQLAANGELSGLTGIRRANQILADAQEQARKLGDQLLGGNADRARRELQTLLGIRSQSQEARTEARPGFGFGNARDVNINLNVGGTRVQVSATDEDAQTLIRALERAQLTSAST